MHACLGQVFSCLSIMQEWLDIASPCLFMSSHSQGTHKIKPPNIKMKEWMCLCFSDAMSHMLVTPPKVNSFLIVRFILFIHFCSIEDNATFKLGGMNYICLHACQFEFNVLPMCIIVDLHVVYLSLYWLSLIVIASLVICLPLIFIFGDRKIARMVIL